VIVGGPGNGRRAGDVLQLEINGLSSLDIGIIDDGDRDRLGGAVGGADGKCHRGWRCVCVVIAGTDGCGPV